MHCTSSIILQGGFEWLVVDDHQNSVFAFIRRDANNHEILVVANFTPIVRHNYRIGVHHPGHYQEIINTDSHYYRGSNVGNRGAISTQAIASHGKEYSLNLVLPPLATLYLKREQTNDDI